MGALADGEAEGGPALGGGDAAGEAHAGPAGTGSSSDRTKHLGLGLAGLRPSPSTALSVSRCAAARAWPPFGAQLLELRAQPHHHVAMPLPVLRLP